MRFSHQEYVEIYSALKNGCWVNHQVKEDLIKQLEEYLIRAACHKDTKVKEGS